jgi:ADP-heptose:LPS heptosyltransferase
MIVRQRAISRGQSVMNVKHGSFLFHAEPRNVVIFRALHLGDMLCWIPALRSLRHALPDAHISLVGLPWVRTFCRHFASYLDEWIEFPGYPALEERPLMLDRVPSFIAELQARRFDLALQMHGNGLVANSLVALFGARHTAGFFHEKSYIPNPDGFIPYPEHQPEIWRHLSLMQHLGCTDLSPDLEFPVTPGMAELDEVFKQKRLEDAGPIVCLHPGAKAEWRRWPVAAFARVGDGLAALGYTIVITGTAEEAPLAAGILEHMRWPACNLTGAFSDIGPLASLLATSDLLVCGDTGLSHLACAVRCPSVVLFLKSELQGWPPLNRSLHRVVSHPLGVTPDLVLKEALDLLQQQAAHRPYAAPLSTSVPAAA